MGSISKVPDDYEADKATAAELNGESYQRILKQEFRDYLGCPKDSDGKLDYNAALTGDDLKDFINKAISHLRGFTIC